MRFLRRIFGFFFGMIRAVVWTVGLLTIGIFCYFYVASRPLPRETLNRLLIKLSTETDAVDARAVLFGLREGLTLQKVRVLPKGVVAPEWFSADEIRLSGSFRLDRPPQEWIDSVVAHEVRVSSLPTNMLAGSSTSASGMDVASPIRFDLVDATFLDMRFKRLQGVIRQEKGVLIVENIRIEWPSDRWTEEATGSVRYNPGTGLIEGQLTGRLIPERLYPLLHMLQANGVLEVAQRFVFNTSPIELEARFRVAPAEPNYELRLTLAVADCTYSGVPVTRVNTVIVANGSNDLTHVAIQPLVCERPDGKLSGSLVIDTITSNVDFIAQSDMPVDPLLHLIRVDIEPEKYGIFFLTAPRLTATGRVPLDGNIDGVAFTGTLSAPTAMVRRIPLQNFQCEVSMVTNSYLLRNVRASTSGGDIRGTLNLLFPPSVNTQVFYRTSFQVDHLNVETFAAQLGLTNYASGTAQAEIALSSAFGTNHDRLLCGNGFVQVEKGMLGRVPLFAGLTDSLARHVPGVEFLVSQTEARLPFVITNGVLQAEHVLVEGDVFNISGKGAYHFPGDQLDFVVRANVFKRTTWLGKIVRLVTFPFSKLLMEFHVKGSVNQPIWEYRGVIERIVDTVGDAVGGKKDSAP
ncbi:MAG: AsmA-like C-terminal region-containing protein [bacterium]